MSALILSKGAVLTDNIEDYPEGIIIPVDKPYRWTSADVIRKIKRAACRHFGKKNLKVGHAGTLDPLATGILLVCIGPATKRAEDLQRSRKQYLAGVTFGATTPSYDLEKEIDRTCPLDGVSEEAVRNVLPSFVGEQDQVAPLFSAKSVDGVRAYETARRLYREAQRSGADFDHSAAELLQTNRINIYGLRLEEYRGGDCPGETATARGPVNGVGTDPAGGDKCEARSSMGRMLPRTGGEAGNDRKGRIHVADISGYDLPTAMIRVDCSKGTYIRSLARDLGEALGSGAFLSSLRRTGNGGFSIDDAISLDDALALFLDD